MVGLAVAGWGAWEYISAILYFSKLKSTIFEADSQIKQVESRLQSEKRELKDMTIALGGSSTEDLKQKLANFQKSEIEKKSLEEKLKVMKKEKDYNNLIEEEEEIKGKIRSYNKQLESMGALGYTPREIKEEIKKLEDYLIKKGMTVERFDESRAVGSKGKRFGTGMKPSRFPDDHIARFLSIATELVQKGQMEPLGELQKSFNSYVQLLTNKNYTRATFSKGGVIKFFKSDNLMRVGIDSMSPATKDGVYFALKLALIESILKKRAVPIILDDPFLLMDDERLTAVNSILKELSKHTQVIHLTSRQAALKGADRSFKIK